MIDWINFQINNFDFHYWYMLPISIVIAILANSSGFSGGVLFQPIYNLFLNIPIQSAVATGIATEAVGMTSGALRYVYYKMVELPIAFTMIMLTIPGVVVGNFALISPLEYSQNLHDPGSVTLCATWKQANLQCLGIHQ